MFSFYSSQIGLISSLQASCKVYFNPVQTRVQPICSSGTSHDKDSMFVELKDFFLITTKFWWVIWPVSMLHSLQQIQPGFFSHPSRGRGSARGARAETVTRQASKLTQDLLCFHHPPCNPHGFTERLTLWNASPRADPKGSSRHFLIRSCHLGFRKGTGEHASGHFLVNRQRNIGHGQQWARRAGTSPQRCYSVCLDPEQKKSGRCCQWTAAEKQFGKTIPPGENNTCLAQAACPSLHAVPNPERLRHPHNDDGFLLVFKAWGRGGIVKYQS